MLSLWHNLRTFNLRFDFDGSYCINISEYQKLKSGPDASTGTGSDGAAANLPTNVQGENQTDEGGYLISLV